MGSLVTSTTLVTGDDSWLGSAHGTDSTESITLDVSAFTANTHYANGVFHAGIPLGKITASGKYGPYGASPSEVQTLVIDATGGTYDITFDGDNTGNITYAGTAGDSATMQAALETLPNISPGDVTVTQGATVSNSTTFTLTFGGNYTGLNVPQITVSESLTGGAGTATPATGTAGGGSVSSGAETLVGFLYTAVPVPDTADTTIDCAAAMLTHGKVVEANLPISVDAAGKLDVAGRIRFV